MVECPFKMTTMPDGTVWCCAVGLIIQYSPPIHCILLSSIVKLHIITTGGQHHHSLPTHCLPVWVSQPKIDLSEQTFLSQQWGYNISIGLIDFQFLWQLLKYLNSKHIINNIYANVFVLSKTLFLYPSFDQVPVIWKPILLASILKRMRGPCLRTRVWQCTSCEEGNLYSQSAEIFYCMLSACSKNSLLVNRWEIKFHNCFLCSHIVMFFSYPVKSCASFFGNTIQQPIITG